ncbi:MAG: hypothetical protein LQ352_006473, partial [Teloschistes flavicans]
MGSTRNSFMSTYQTTRPVKCLYIDGASAKLGNDGTMDTQMLFLYGNVTGPLGRNGTAQFFWDEYARAQGLCQWLHQRNLDVPGQGIEAIVRMSAGFELIWCNFSSPSLRLISRFNVSVPLLEFNRTSLMTGRSNGPESRRSIGTQRDPKYDLPAPDWEIDWEHEPFIASQQWDWFTSMSRTYELEDMASERDPAIRLLDFDLVSLYSPDYRDLMATMGKHEREQFNLTTDGLWEGPTSQGSRHAALQGLMRRRHRHRAGNLSTHEITILHRDTEQMLSRLVSQEGPHIITISWSRLCDTIVNSFAKPLMHFQQLLLQLHSPSAAAAAAAPSLPSTKQGFASLREHAHAMLMPFFDYQQQPESLPSSLHRCKNIYLPWQTDHTYNQAAAATAPDDNLKTHFVGQAMEEVLENICSTLINLGASIEESWLQNFNDDDHHHTPDRGHLQHLN